MCINRNQGYFMTQPTLTFFFQLSSSVPKPQRLRKQVEEASEEGEEAT